MDPSYRIPTLKLCEMHSQTLSSYRIPPTLKLCEMHPQTVSSYRIPTLIFCEMHTQTFLKWLFFHVKSCYFVWQFSAFFFSSYFNLNEISILFWWNNLCIYNNTYEVFGHMYIFFFIMPRSRFDNTLYFDITFMPNGVIVLWPALT